MFYQEIILSKFRSTSLEQREINGIMEDCIVIPLRINGIVRYKSGKVVLSTVIHPKKPNAYNETHYVSVCIGDPEVREENKRLGFAKDLMFIGRFKDNKYSKKTRNKKGKNSSVMDE